MKPQPVLTLTASGPGDVSDIQDFQCRQATCFSVIISGNSVDLNAKADPGAAFNGWGGACASFGKATTCTLVMNGNKAVSATFVNAGPLPAPVQLSPPDGFNVPRTKRLEIVSVDVTWQAVPGADHYEVENQEISFLTGNPMSDTTGTTKGTSFTVTVDCSFPTEGPFERWRVTAIAPDGTRGLSSPWRRMNC